jgi:hypothetical protein
LGKRKIELSIDNRASNVLLSVRSYKIILNKRILLVDSVKNNLGQIIKNDNQVVFPQHRASWIFSLFHDVNHNDNLEFELESNRGTIKQKVG